MTNREELTNEDFKASIDTVKDEVNSLKAQGFDTESNLFGSKRLIKVNLNTGNCLLVCSFTKTVLYKMKKYHYTRKGKNLTQWMANNNLVKR